ncbi:MAG: aminotransferase class V-fold PLP-dependent enzyme [Candidatus Eremiobacteraeota bacterium]|nr:aminotransferase class V-fold PLP-dependent enzyme [Candidatus Eremiobacteraeota bacterium]
MSAVTGEVGSARQTPLDRRLFPITSSWAYCNHAAVGPLPRPTRQAVAAVLDAQMNEGSAGILDVESHLESIRAQTAAAINASADDVAFLRSTSDGALVAANGLAWRSGDEIIISDNEFGANAYPWLFLRDRGVRIAFVRTPHERLTVEQLDTMRTKRTRLVAVSYVSSMDGYRHDVSALGRYCREHGIIFAVDAMQGFGPLPLDVRNWNIDVCYFGVAKWLLSPQGLSVLYARRDLAESMRPAMCSWRSVQDPMDFFDYGQELLPGARRFDGATVNYPALIGFRESLRLHSEASFAAIERHVRMLCDRLIDGARTRGIDVKSDESAAARSAIVLLGLGRWQPDHLNAKALADKVGITVRDSGVRVSPHGYNNEADIDAVLELLAARPENAADAPRRADEGALRP